MKIFNKKSCLRNKTKSRVLSYVMILMLVVTNSKIVFAETVKQYNLIRLSGQNRYETSLNIAKEFENGPVDNVLVTSGNNFPDALTGSVLSKGLKAPILLLNKKVDRSKNSIDYIKDHLKKEGTIYILGGTGVVSDDFITQFNGLGFKNIIRLGGIDRFDTNKKIIDQLAPSKGTPIIIANGYEFADALSVSSIAAIKGYPIFISNTKSIPESIKTKISELQPSKVYILGGIGALTEDIKDQVKSLTSLMDADILRVGGENRYETSLNICNIFKLDTDTIVIANGKKFPDALSGSALAVKSNSPIILTDGKDIAKQKEYIDKFGYTKVVLLGGTAAIDKSVEDMFNKVVQENTNPGDSTLKTPIIEFFNDNGVMEFTAKEVDSEYKYTLNIKQNENTKDIKVDAMKPIIVPKETLAGYYKYQLIGISPSGATVKSNIVNYIVTNTGSGQIGSDADEDGISDEIELKIGTSSIKSDTDGDGLLDGYEYNILGTSPTKTDTDGNDISDANEDFDGDGLSNLKEYQINTNPMLDDTDNDGLNDEDEVSKHLTNPLESDSDEDKLNDYDEIILGFNPLIKDTNSNGILDNDEKLNQVISNDNIVDKLLVENEAIPSLTVLTNGNANKSATISEYSGIEFGESRSIVGKPLEIKGVVFDSAKMSFTLKLDSTLNGDDLLICRHDDSAKTVYYETNYDSTQKRLSSNIDVPGTYFVLNVKELFSELGLTLPAEMDSKESLRTSKKAEPEVVITESMNNGPSKTITTNNLINKEVEVVNTEKVTSLAGAAGQADIVFLIDTTGSMGDEINNVKNNVTAFVDELKLRGIAPSLSLVEYKDIVEDGLGTTIVHKNGDKNWFSNVEAYKDVIKTLVASGGGDTPECVIDALETARLLNMRSMAGKFFILITDANYKIDNRYGIPSMDYEIQLLNNQNICSSVVTSTGLYSTYNSLVTQTDGIFANINGNFGTELNAIADKIGKTVIDDGVWVYLQGAIPIPVKLKKLPEVGDITTDTDEDGIPDSLELKSVTPTGKVNLDEIITKVSKGIITGTSYGQVQMYEYNSNPAITDTDKDTYSDDEDLAPKEAFVTPVMLLHGRTDNIEDAFGLRTNIKVDDNNNYGNSKTVEDELSYTDVENQKIVKVMDINKLGSGIISDNYKINYNLFAFNYPNQDMAQFNAEKLKTYTDNLISAAKSGTDKEIKLSGIFATESDVTDDNFKFDLIGHSNGGLVSRYYIENLNNSKNVRKLITIDTPHYGSGPAYASDAIDLAEFITPMYPIDVELNPSSTLYGGRQKTFLSLRNPERARYINNSQSPELKGNDSVDTVYYAIGGYDVKGKGTGGFIKDEMDGIPSDLRNKQFIFDFNRGLVTINAFNDSIRQGAYAINADIKLDLFDSLFISSGDNVVNIQSQFGVRDILGFITEYISFYKTSLNVDTVTGHDLINHFHGLNQNNRNTINKILDYLQE